MSRLTSAATLSLFQRLSQRFAAWRLRRQEMAELFCMNDRDLADIGISRGDLVAISKGTFESSRTSRQGVMSASRQAPAQVSVSQTRIAA
jgi:uncharacterized protein YjiS (DUF1127 family)